MYNPFYSKTHQYFYVQTEIAAGADEDLGAAPAQREGNLHAPWQGPERVTTE